MMGALGWFLVVCVGVVLMVGGFGSWVVFDVMDDKKTAQSIEDANQHIDVLEQDLAECKAARDSCDEMKLQFESANSEREIWRDLAVQCVGKKLEVKNR